MTESELEEFEDNWEKLGETIESMPEDSKIQEYYNSFDDDELVELGSLVVMAQYLGLEIHFYKSGDDFVCSCSHYGTTVFSNSDENPTHAAKKTYVSLLKWHIERNKK